MSMQREQTGSTGSDREQTRRPAGTPWALALVILLATTLVTTAMPTALAAGHEDLVDPPSPGLEDTQAVLTCLGNVMDALVEHVSAGDPAGFLYPEEGHCKDQWDEMND